MQHNNYDDLTALSSIRDFIRWAASRFTEAELFFGHGTANALDEAVALVLHSLHLPYALSESYFSAVLTEAERNQLVHIIEQRIEKRIPAAYLTHEAMFAGLCFFVDERVLVPRSPIAELIEEQFVPWVDPEQVSNILDLCTGSACIACACAYAFPDAAVDALDLSEQALQVAHINVQKHKLSEQVRLIQSDLFAGLEAKKYDLIVSNPPYVSLTELQQLPAEYHAEPYMGFAGGQSGLDIVFRILLQAPAYLTDHGILIVEVGSSAETLQRQFPDVPFYWLAFEQGGDGVFLLTAEQLKQYAELFTAKGGQNAMV